ncbi:hypothetical protein [Achromobacter spanius]|uniref:hypothetical protein n=1 Tax=Achromobacter spanius TaxID=217203 RepID=UPI003F68F1EF
MKINHATVVVLMLLFAAGLVPKVAAETTVSAAYTYAEGDNKYGTRGWRSMRQGSGAMLGFRHDIGNVRFGVELEQMSLEVRNVERFPTANLWPAYDHKLLADFRHRSVRVMAGWSHAFDNRIGLWADGGVVFDRWAGGVDTVLTHHVTQEPVHRVLDPQSHRHWAALGRMGVSIPLWRNAKLDTGIAYQNKTYYLKRAEGGAGWWNAAVPEDFGSEALIEGTARLHQRFGEHWGAFVEYRHGTQREYARVGLDWRF